MTHTFAISITFSSFEGLVARVALLTERRSFVIESLIVRKPQDRLPFLSLVLSGPEARFEQVCKQLQKLVDVVTVEEVAVVEKAEILALSA